MSGASPTRPTGSAAPMSRYIVSRSASDILLHSAVLTTPGETALTRIGASSIASARVSASIAPQMLAATVHPLRGRRLAIPVVRTIEPPGRISLPAYFAAANATPEAQIERLPRLIERGVRKFAELQRFAGGEDQMIESADPVEQAAHRFLVRKIERMALGAGGQGCERVCDSALPARGH